MMKKMIALLLALVLALSLAITAIAAPTSASGISGTSGSGGMINIWNALSVDYSSKIKAAVAAVSKTWNAQLAAARRGVDNADELLPFAVIDINGAQDNDTITLNVPLEAGTRVVVMRYVEATRTWEKAFEGMVTDGKITIQSETYSSSPFVIMVKSDNGGEDSGVSGTVKHMLLNTISKISSEATQQPVVYSVAKTAAVAAGTVLVWQVVRYVVALAHMVG